LRVEPVSDKTFSMSFECQFMHFAFVDSEYHHKKHTTAINFLAASRGFSFTWMAGLVVENERRGSSKFRGIIVWIQEL
jgi:hypothetical protein